MEERIQENAKGQSSANSGANTQHHDGQPEMENEHPDTVDADFKEVSK